MNVNFMLIVDKCIKLQISTVFYFFFFKGNCIQKGLGTQKKFLLMIYCNVEINKVHIYQ